MKKIIFSILIFASTGAQTQPYDISSETISSAYARSMYYTADANPLPLKIDEFLKEADQSIPVVVHAHGCFGVGWDEAKLGDFYAEQKVNFVFMNFLKLNRASCESYPSAWHEAANPARINARRLEMESQIQWLKNKGFKRIFVSGHSEGGRTAQGLKTKVEGIFIYSMDCKADKSQFWEPNPENKIKIFISSQDPWLDYPRSAIRGCRHLFNRGYVQDYWSSKPAHGVLIEQEWRDVIARELKN